MTQKTFNVFIKKLGSSYGGEHVLCSRKVYKGTYPNRILTTVKITDETIDYGARVNSCDVADYFKSLGLKDNEVISAKITIKTNL